jgi:ABC-type multidrug transport system ATPase subunit
MSAFPADAVRASLRVVGMSKSYGRVTALDGVSFSIRPGEILSVICRSTP